MAVECTAVEEGGGADLAGARERMRVPGAGDMRTGAGRTWEVVAPWPAPGSLAIPVNSPDEKNGLIYTYYMIQSSNFRAPYQGARRSDEDLKQGDASSHHPMD